MVVVKIEGEKWRRFCEFWVEGACYNFVKKSYNFVNQIDFDPFGKKDNWDLIWKKFNWAWVWKKN